MADFEHGCTGIDKNNYINTKRLCEILGICRRTLFRWIKEDKLPFNHIMYVNGYIWKKKDVIEFMKERKKNGKSSFDAK